MDTCIPIFHKKAVENPSATKEKGRPVFEEKDYVQIIIPGERDIADRVVNSNDLKRWPEQWKAYQDNENVSVSGTMLDQITLFNKAEIATFSSLNIKTVEQLSEIGENVFSKLGPGARDYKKKAQDYLKQAAKSALLNEIQDLKHQVDDLKQQIKDFKQPKKQKNVAP